MKRIGLQLSRNDEVGFATTANGLTVARAASGASYSQ